MSDPKTGFKYEATGDEFHITTTQDVEPYLEENKRRRESNTVGQDWKHKWHLPNVLIEKFYTEYTGGTYKPLNEEFYRWVDKKIMSDSDLAYFRTNNPSNPFHLGYRRGTR